MWAVIKVGIVRGLALSAVVLACPAGLQLGLLFNPVELHLH